jgi:threonine/homoserine/homoserine lactone efflux protein
MPSPLTLALFSLAALALLVVPGPAVLYIVGQSISRGRRAGIASMLGIEVGSLLHVLAATAGLSALLASSASAFAAVRYAGAAYLIVLGILRLVRRKGTDLPEETCVGGLRPLFLQGALVNVLNPKTAVFFLAFLPQFVRPERGPAAVQIMVLGLLFLVLATLSDGLYALLAGSAGARLRRGRRTHSLVRYGSGGVLIGLGVAAAFSGEARK